MKKKIMVLITTAFTILMCTGCFANELEYDINLGYDLSSVKNKDIIFNVYHSNTERHTWELIESFSIQPKMGHYGDVQLHCKENQIKIVLKDSTFSTSEYGSSIVAQLSRQKSKIFIMN